MPVLEFLLKRIAGMVVILAAVSLLVFSLLLLSPGSLVVTLLGSRPATPETIAAVTARYHLDDPIIVQFGHWLGGVLHGDFGRSIQSGQPVTDIIADRLPITLQLALYAVVLVLCVGIPLGMLAGIRHGGKIDSSVSTVTIIGLSTPSFVMGVLLLYAFGVRLRLFPIFGAGSGQFADRIAHLTLPAVALAAGLAALVIRQTRAAVLHVMNQDHVTFARARGLSRTRVLVHYALRNSALPITTAVGLLLIVAVSATVLIETVFSLQGIGLLMQQAIITKDLPVVQALTLVVAFFVVAVNFLVDIAALVIDPRTRSGTKG
jgi:peptide/nickel transport system permease protein